MAYTPKTWNCGDSITIADMNRIESGVAQMSGGGGYLEPLLISFDHYETVDSNQVPCMDKTWQQAYDAFLEGRAIMLDYLSIPDSADITFDRVDLMSITIMDAGPYLFYAYLGFELTLYANTATDYLRLMLAR